MLLNFNLEQPYQHAVYAEAQCTEFLWHNRDKLAANESLGPRDLETHIADLHQVCPLARRDRRHACYSL